MRTKKRAKQTANLRRYLEWLEEQPMIRPAGRAIQRERWRVEAALRNGET